VNWRFLGFSTAALARVAFLTAVAAGESGRPETPLERAVRLSASADAKDRVAAVELLRPLKGVGRMDRERAQWLYGRVALSLRQEWPDGVKEARAAFGELAEKALFDFMRWRGEIGKWEVRLAEARDGLAAKTLAEDKFQAEFSALGDELDRTLGRQNEREYAVNIAHLLGQVREAADDLPGALKAYKHSLHLLETLAKRRKVLSAAVEDYWGPLDAGQIRAAIDRVNGRLNAKKEPQVSFEKARALQTQKKFKEAQALFDKIAKDYPADPLAAASEYYAAECSHGLKDYPDSQQRLQRFIELSPGGSYRGHAHLLLGDILTLLAFDLDKGSREYDAALKPEGYSPWWPKLTRETPRQEKPDKTWDDVRYGACDRLGVIAYFDRKFDDAEKYFRESARLNPSSIEIEGNVPVGMELVVELVQKKKMPELLTDDVLQGDRRVGFALFWASVLGEGWRYREGMAVFDRLAQHLDKAMTEDQRAYLCVRRGEFFWSMEKNDQAEACYQEFSEDSGRYAKSRWGAMACLFYATLLYGRNDKERGEKVLVRSFSRYPNCPWADWAMYQWALMKSRNKNVPPEESLRYVEAALAAYPNSRYVSVARLVVGDLKEDIENAKKKAQSGGN
jgi:tetratricopeptide (TPR) repeat protein